MTAVNNCSLRERHDNNMEEMIHGGDIYRNKVELDFSININPAGVPDDMIAALHKAVDDSTCYPDMEAMELRNSISKLTGAERKEIICGNGASELFLAIVHALKPKKTVIPVPSFYGYEKAVLAGGGIIDWYQMSQEVNYCIDRGIIKRLNEDTDMLFLASPNNPVGNVIPKRLLEQILNHCHKKKIIVVLDECFMGFTEGQKKDSFLLRTKEFDNLILVSAFTKIFAIPGVRLGYLVCSNQIILDKIKNQLPEWNISGFAQKAGIAAKTQRKYLEESRKMIGEERRFLTEELKNLGVTVFSGEANYLMLWTSFSLYENLLQHKILIRDCSNFRGLMKGYYRISVKKREHNERLLLAVREVMQ